jgi:hypothetical protein
MWNVVTRGECHIPFFLYKAYYRPKPGSPVAESPPMPAIRAPCATRAATHVVATYLVLDFLRDSVGENKLADKHFLAMVVCTSGFNFN